MVGVAGWNTDQNSCSGTLLPKRPTKGHRMLFPNRQNFIVFSQNTEIQSALRTQAPMEPLQVFMNPNSSTSILEINISSSKTQHKGPRTRHKLGQANTRRIDMGLISSSTHQQSFHAFRWSWCAGHGHEGPSSDADHGGSWIAQGFC